MCIFTIHVIIHVYMYSHVCTCYFMQVYTVRSCISVTIWGAGHPGFHLHVHLDIVIAVHVATPSCTYMYIHVHVRLQCIIILVIMVIITVSQCSEPVLQLPTHCNTDGI